MADKRCFTMMAASSGQGENRNSEGVISGHAYSLISIHEFQHQGQEVKLLQLRNPWGSGEWQGDWSDKSELWTPALRKKLGSVDGDDGAFFIGLDDYLQHFSWTSICVENNINKYSHSSLYHSFGERDSSPLPQAFFSFNLTKEVDFQKFAFGISCMQQGKRLAMYRQKDPAKLFKPTNFNIVLMTDKGQLINARFGSKFMFSLLNDKNTVLKPGKYIFMVDPIWNDESDNDEAFREVLIDVYGPEAVEIKAVPDEQGIKLLARSLCYAAKNKIDESQREFYLADNEDYGNKVWRVTDIESLDCWYGMIYTKNESRYRLKETLRPQLEGIEVVYPSIQGEDIELDIEVNGEQVIILRRVEDRCSFGLAYLTHGREISDEELIQAARESEDVNQFGDTNAFFKLLNSVEGAVFYIENQESETLEAQFNLKMKNFMIQGGDVTDESFTVKLAPGASTHKILKPIVENEETSLELQYSFRLGEE